MAYAEQTGTLRGPINEHGTALAYEWRRLTRAATFVALLTAPAFFLVLHDSNHLGLLASVLLTALAVLLFRGLVEVVVRRFLPWPSLYGAGSELKEEDIVARRRYWYWRSKYRRVPWWIGSILALLVLCQLLFAFAGVSASFFNPFAGLRTIFPPDTLPQLALVFVQLPLLLFINVFILFGPFLFMAARGIRSYEPGDASWGVKIDDVRGQAEAKEEITRVITLWQSGEEFEKAGGKRERGLLFLGAPGTGKTMISKAIATNFNCPFVTIPGSGFAQMFMGMDALVVQLLAHRARKLARKWGGQCIVFIDEIDAIGQRRGGAMVVANDEREQTLNQLLVEMDGFEMKDNIILIAATNRPDILDPALLRPGRFDRRVVVQPPDRVGREAILRVHTRSVPLSEEIDLGQIASTTPGMVGADLANLVNESALLAAKRNHPAVNQQDLSDALERIVLGAARSVVISDEDRRRTACHEAGHAVVGMLTPGADPVRKVSIIPRGQALGVTFSAPDADRFNLDQRHLLAQIKVALGGRCAEEIVYGDLTTGAESDIQHLTRIARFMVGRWGMSNAIGPIAVLPQEGTSMLLPGVSETSERTQQLVDEEVHRIVDQAHAEVLTLLREHRTALDDLVTELLASETLDMQDAYAAAGIAAPAPAPASEAPSLAG